MKRVISLILLVGTLSGCLPENPIPTHWNADYAQYMQEFGYTYNENDGVILKNGVTIWALPIHCIRYCVSSYVGPHGLQGDLAEDYNRAIEQSIKAYKQENLQILGLDEEYEN